MVVWNLHLFWNDNQGKVLEQLQLYQGILNIADFATNTWKVERTIAWLKTRYRRISTRWERKVKYWNGFLQCALIGFWLKFLSQKIW
jgi:hypothetical protein